MKENKSNWRRLVSISRIPKMLLLGAVLLATSIASAQTLDVTLTPFEYNGNFNVRCTGQNSGRVTATATGGTLPYTYSWSAGFPIGDGSIAVGLFAGTCTLTVTDSTGASVTESVVLNEPTPLVPDVTWTPILCFGDAATVTVNATGGTTPYNGTLMTDVTEGTYTYNLSDANACRASQTVVITQPDVLAVSASATPILCFGETSDVTVTATGGTVPYSGNGNITSSAGTNDYYVTDANGCTNMAQLTIIQPGQLTASVDFTPILCNGETSQVTVTAISGTEPYAIGGNSIETAGTYTYDVVDFNMCEYQLTVTIPEPPLLEVSATDGVAPSGGTADIVVTATGGTPSYVGDGTFPQGIGTQSYMVTDANGCTASDVATVIALDPLQISFLTTSCSTVYPGIGYDYSCGTISAEATGGSSNYSYLWSTGETTSSIVVCPSTTTTYTCTVTDGTGATSTSSWTITATDITCVGNNSSYSSSGLCGGSSNSSSGNVNGCILPYDGTATCGTNGSSSSSSSSYGSVTTKVMMCYNGITQCVSAEHIAAKLKCGYIFGACGSDQPCEVAIEEVQDSTVLSCVCSGTLTSINVRYVGPNNETVNSSAKDCGIPLSDHANLSTGDVFTVAASDGGLANLRNNTYLGLAGWNYGRVRIPTNCCENPVGKVYFPFQVIGWTDSNGNSCGDVANGGINGMQTTMGQAGKESVLAQKTATIKQYPNPAETSATFEFSVPKTEVVSVSIVGINGQLIETIANKEVVADQSYSLTYDLSELQSGIYFVHLTSSEGVMKKKFVVLK